MVTSSLEEVASSMMWWDVAVTPTTAAIALQKYIQKMQ